LTWSTWFGLCLKSSIVIAVVSWALFKVSIISITLPVLRLYWSVSQSDLISFSITLPMILREDIARLVANLECITVQIIITSLLAELSWDPILFKGAIIHIVIINTFAFLLRVIVDKLAPDTMICW
jgi:hypothetical protein